MPEPRTDRPHATPMDSTGKTKQSERDSANINTIIANYRTTGVLNSVNSRTPLYGDFTQPQDLQSQLHRTMEAQERFDALPAALRKAAGNDMVKFLEMTQDDEGLALLEDLGLVMVDGLEGLDQAEVSPSSEAEEASPTIPTPTGGE